MNLSSTLRKALALLLIAASLGWVAAPVRSAPLNISDLPLFLTANIAPNVVLTLDDSGSMARAFTPDLCGNPNAICDNNPDSRLDHRYLKSSHFNPIYYNPNINYTAPKNANGNALTTTFANAWVNGYVNSLPDISPDSFNLASEYRPTAGLRLTTGTKSHEFMRHFSSDVRCSGGGTKYCQYNSNVGGSGSANWVGMGGASCTSDAQCQLRQMPAYYYVFDESNNQCTGTAAQKKVDNDCYDIRIVSATSGADRNGDGVISAAEADERQNFANWYSFYRTRSLATIASASLAFAEFDDTTRLAWQGLNSCRGSTSSLVDSNCDAWSGNLGFSNAIKPFAGTHKQNFYTWLFRQNTNSSTPLREAMVRAGSYFSTTGENSPYDNDLLTSGTVTATSGQLSCRKNFHILMTDGIWNDSTPAGVSDVDSSLAAPYRGTAEASLADVAYKYWSTDLTALANNLLPYIVEAGLEPGQSNNPRNDPATWQHMVNFTVGLGLTPFLDSVGLIYAGSTYSGSYPSIAAGTTAWPSIASDGGKVADLWHAAINSRGQFFSADTPETMVAAFGAVRNAIQAATPSAAALAANSTSIQTGALVYQATFDSSDWSGDLVAYPVLAGGVVGAASWNAASKLPLPGARTIFTFNGSNSTNFSWDSLSAAQQTALNTLGGVEDNLGEARVDWLRGGQSQEVVVTNGVVTSGTFRQRDSVLGDIINSDPAFAHRDDFGYANMGGGATEAATYQAYVNGKSTRTPAVFVGGNDGMLHAFRADTGNADSGVELFAYVPNGVYDKLSRLTAPDYVHEYYVDGGPTVGDAFLSTGWTTVLVGGLGGGGKSIYALNVSNVASPSAAMVMWEYTDTDMGLTYSKPQIARLNNGQWVAVFGNGYNSASERAYLYVVNLESGALVAKIAAGTATSNGLSSPTLHDADGDLIMDFAYAGDLQGNLWKFDLTSFADQSTPHFIARNASNQVQPITAAPTIGSHPDGGVMVYFGTGQYLQSVDVMNTNVQTFYGIRDNGTAILTTDRSELQQQTIDAQTTEFGVEVRQTSDNSVDWVARQGWYMDLDHPTPVGERVVTQALLRYGRVIFLTLIPSADACRAGGESWLMELDAITGGRTATSSFDFNNDDQFDSDDELASGEVASGVKTSVGITKPPAWFKGEDGKDFKVMTGTTGGIQSLGNKGEDVPPGDNSLRRTYWRQIQ